MKSYEPPGSIGIVGATRAIAELRYPARWEPSKISENEMDVWNGLYGICGDLDPRILDNHSFARVRNRSSETVHRRCDFIEARTALRDALCNSGTTDFYFNEIGEMKKVRPHLWAGPVGDRMIEIGTQWFDDDETTEVCRYLLVQKNHLKQIAAAIDSSNTLTKSAKQPPTISKLGRKPTYDWAAVEKFVFETLDHHGLPCPEDESFRNQAALERRILEFCLREFGTEPAISGVRPKLAKWLKNFKDQKVRK